MQLSRKVRCGLRILVQVGAETAGTSRAVKGRMIAESQDLSEGYMEQLMIPLKDAGLIETVRGRSGGYRLGTSPSVVTLLDVMELFEGPMDLVDCNQGGLACPRQSACPTSSAWARLSRALRREASQIALSDLVRDVRSRRSPEYMI
ncbi:MAG: Rrf2 family transcriptional regulator [Lentisphaeria bacterium]|nr:Rrf2 family transcriptional regulator [Lentisphaeria bacterium]